MNAKNKKDLKLIKLAEKYKKKILKLLNNAIKGIVIGDENNMDSWFYIRDAADHIKICNFINKNSLNYKKCYDKMWDLDTSSREGFPAEIWNYLGSKIEGI